MHGVRDFVLSTHHELTNILRDTGDRTAGELGLIVGLALPKGGRARSVGQVWRLDRRCGRPSALARRYTAQLELSFTLVRNASSRSRGGGRWR